MMWVVYVLMEFPVDKPKERSLYGVFFSEQEAQADYGDVSGAYAIEIIKCRVFGR